ncbi:MAG TPA: folylpolyglutamate synthase/dihydrofolate synthase family protein [bacterium]|nr:folylpolyglutamate synthase/dihydrofolate synthase family protein [bacterium]
MTYAEAQRWLEDLIHPERPRRPYTDVKLARMRDLLARIGDPQTQLRAVLIAGTKGKGSTAVMVSEILRAAGLRVGLAVKPHLVDYRERIQVDGQMIPEDDLVSLVDAVRPAVDAASAGPWGLATYVEVTVAMAFLYFVRRQVDIAVVEVGIGGRLDATNTLDPVVSVITPISYDHTELLGTTLEAIAGEKAGIIRPGGRVVSAPQPPEADRVITAAAQAAGARLVRVGRDVPVRLEEASLSGVHAVIDGEGGRYDVRVPLVGRHQAQNAATAIAAVEALGGVGIRVPRDTVRAALGAVRWPARLEVVDTRPYTIVDAGHNPASMLALRDTLRELLGGRRLVLLFGMLATKDYHAVTALIAPLAHQVVTTRPDNPHALTAEQLAAEIRRHTPHVVAIEDRAQALDEARRLTGPDDVLVVTGSFYMVGEARERLLRRKPATQARR